MRKQIHWIVILILIMGLALVACNGGDNGEDVAPQATSVSEPEQVEAEVVPTNTAVPTATPAPTDTPAPTATPIPTATEEPTEEMIDASELDLETLQEGLVNFDSYRIVVDIDITSTDSNNNENHAVMQLEMANVADPPASSLTMTAEGIEQFEELGSLAMAQIDGISYITFPGLGCITNPAEGDLMDSFGEDFLDTSEFTDKLDEARLVGEEVINDIEVLHYEADSSLLEEDDNDLDELSGDIYIAKEGRYLVSMILDGTGPMDFFSEGEDSYGTMHMEYNLIDINEPVEITLPEGCDESAAESGAEFPVTADAYELSSFSGFTSYKSDLPFAEVVAFYEAGLAEEGWTKVEADSFASEDTAVLVYTRDEEKLNITIGPDDDDSVFVLMISE